MADGIKISEFEEIDELQEACSLPTISDGKNRKITYGALRNQLINELKASGVTAFVDITNLVTWNSHVTNQSLLAALDKSTNIVTLYVAFTVNITKSWKTQSIFSGLNYKPRDTSVTSPVWIIVDDIGEGLVPFRFRVKLDGTADLISDSSQASMKYPMYSAIAYFKIVEE